MVPEFAEQELLGRMDEVYRSGSPIFNRERVLIDLDHSGDLWELIVDAAIVPSRGIDGAVIGLVVHWVDVTQTATTRHAQATEITSLGRQVESVVKMVSTLQQVLLPAMLPVVPGVLLAARYLVTGHVRAAGGDWFDAVPLGDGRIALVVGDVVGHGVKASAVMGQLRAALMASLLDGVGITEAMGRLDRFAQQLPGARGATLGLGLLNRHTGEFNYLSRAHPPPVVVCADGTVRVVSVRPAAPLGFTTPAPEIHRARLRAGEAVVLYSDGLVERRGATLSSGIEALCRVASQAVQAPAPELAAYPLPDRICAGVIDLVPPNHGDDVTVLVTQLLPDGIDLQVTFPALPTEFSNFRDQLRGWLSAIDPSQHEHWETELAVGEAVTNAIEWAYPDQPGSVTVVGSFEDSGHVNITVSDQGRWQPPQLEPGHRGRGLSMMRAVTDSLTIDHSNPGTKVHLRRRLGRPVHFDERQPSTAPDTPNGYSVEIVRGEQPVLVVSGSIDFSTVERFRHALSDASRGGALPLVVDLSKVTLLASGGVQALHEIADGRPRGLRLRLIVPPGSLVRDILTMTGLDQLCQILDRARAPRTSTAEPSEPD